MMIRVGKIRYQYGRQVYPSYPGYTPIVVMTKSSEYGELGPYVLKDDDGRIMENLWQFSKVYPIVPEVDEVYTQKYPIPVWKYHSEIHIDNDVVTDQYWNWRNKGYNNYMPVRYPVGRSNMHTCSFALPYDATMDTKDNRLSYIDARKKIYVPLYTEMVQKVDTFHQLKARLNNGENLLIIEIDGPCWESMNYYKKKYNVGNNFIHMDTMIATKDNIQIMLDDPKHPFGHGYCLAAALQDIILE